MTVLDSQIKKAFNTQSGFTQKDITAVVHDFNVSGQLFIDGDRNKIKIFDINDKTINVKSFKIPNVINQIAYRFFRKSKAQRSFEYASKLKTLEIGTPEPIAFYEFVTPLTFKRSYYVSEQLECDLTYRDLTTNLNYPDAEEILRAFTRFTYGLHEKNVLFLDHSPGNTLIKKSAKGYDFFLVDLNRMTFKSLTFEERIKNFARLTIHKSIIEIMSAEYAQCIGRNPEEVFKLMWHYTTTFQEKYYRKKRLKKKLKFWKS